MVVSSVGVAGGLERWCGWWRARRCSAVELFGWIAGSGRVFGEWVVRWRVGVGGSDRTRRRARWSRASRRRAGVGCVGRCGRSVRRCAAGCSGVVSVRRWRGRRRGRVLAPGEQVVGDEYGGQPGVVDGESARRQVGAAGVFEVADQSLGSSAAAVDRFEVGDVGVGLVGDERLEAVPVDIGERELGAGMGDLRDGRSSGSLPASRSTVDEVGDLGDLGVVAVVGAVGGDRRLPRRFGIAKHAARTGSVRSWPTRTARCVPGRRRRSRATAGRVGPGDHLHRRSGRSGAGRGPVEHADVIGGGVRPGVARSQHPGECFTGGVQKASSGWNPNPRL